MDGGGLGGGGEGFILLGVGSYPRVCSSVSANSDSAEQYSGCKSADDLAAMSADGIADSEVPTNCPLVLSDEALRKTCSLTLLACEQYLARDRTTAAVPQLIKTEPRVAAAITAPNSYSR
jgi:hypothetical protein